VHLYDIPMICMLAGLAFYAVLGGADFGAGLWQLVTILRPQSSERERQSAERIREHAHHAMGPVWEANHVWLIFVLTVGWTAYPSAFSSIASTLAVPLLIAGIGIILRGAAYALRAGSSKASELGRIDTIFSLSSILTPFALGLIVGAIASRRVPVGNATGSLITSWLNPTSLLIGVLAVAFCAYMAAVYLAADAQREQKTELVEQFRIRALISGLLAGLLAAVGLAIIRFDAHALFQGLIYGPGLAGLLISLLAGIATLMLVTKRRFGLARISASLAVVGTIIGWALAQQPILLIHLTIEQAAAPHETLVVILVAIAMGGVILFPSLGLLFGLVLRGDLDHAAQSAAGAPGTPSGLPSAPSSVHARLAIAGLIGGLGLLTAADASWAHGLGVACLFVCMIFAFLAVGPAQLAELADESGPSPGRSPKPRAEDR
jgi:cytochrome bd ubiquinol oxidase subunit II